MDYIYLAEKRVSRLGFGMWPLSGLPKRPAWDEAIALIHWALDRGGVSILDTADSYHLPDEPVGYGEVLVADALRQWGGRREDVLVATKGGRAVNPPDGSRYCTGGPSQLTAAAEASRERLEVDIIDLYYFHRPDPEVPFAQSVEALAQLVDKGVIRTAGVSNVDRGGQILVAKEILGESLVAVQNQYSFWFRSSESEIDLAADLGLAFFPWSPFGGGRTGSPVSMRSGGRSPKLRITREHRATRLSWPGCWPAMSGWFRFPVPVGNRSQGLTRRL